MIHRVTTDQTEAQHGLLTHLALQVADYRIPGGKLKDSVARHLAGLTKAEASQAIDSLIAAGCRKPARKKTTRKTTRRYNRHANCQFVGRCVDGFTNGCGA